MYQPVSAFQDKRFNIYKLNQYALLLSISEHRLRIACIEHGTNRCLLLEAYQIENITSSAYLLIELQKFFQEHPFIATVGWRKVVVIFENERYTLIPTHLYQEGYAADYLKLTVDIVQQEVGYYHHHTELGTTVVFAIDAAIVDWLKNGYQSKDFRVIHQASALITSTHFYLYRKQLVAEAAVLVIADSNVMHITVMDQAKLVYYNRFAYNSSDEFLQYILIVMYTLALTPEFHQVILGGSIARNSVAHQKICSYIRHVSFIERPPHLQLAWALKKELLTNYFELLNFYPAVE